MTFEEAEKIFRDWQNFQEIASKLLTIFLVVPESFLPYPLETLEEALNMIAKHYFDLGNKEAVRSIHETMALYFTGYYISNSDSQLQAKDKKLTDKEALLKMKQDLNLMFEHPELLKVKLENLEKSQKSWLEFKGKNNP